MFKKRCGWKNAGGEMKEWEGRIEKVHHSSETPGNEEKGKSESKVDVK